MTPLRSLRSRVFVAMLAVAAMALSLALGLVTSRAGREAEAELRRDLERAAGVLAEQQAARDETLRTVARLIADLPKLKAAVDTADPATIEPIALDYLARARAALLFVADRRGRPLSQVGRPAPGAVDVAAALQGRESARFEAAADAVVRIVTVPILLEPEILGALGLGFFVDEAEAARLKAATDSEIAIVKGGRVRASTLDRGHDAALAAAAAIAGVGTIRLAGDDWLALARPLGRDPGDPTALLLRSRSERLGYLRTLRAALLLAALLATGLAVLLSFGLARSVTRPLSALTEAMREMAATGDLGARLPAPGRLDDEDAALLASSFGGLAAALERFQREAALRERLAALGRLSTVIAHEVRNPLMSIKASLASLRQAGAADKGVAEAAADIDHEVARLNRIVGDVLDFARPVRVEYARADVHALVREAALSVFPPERVAFERPEAPLEIETDADRLRAALVNVLENAREAMAEARQGDATVSVGVQAPPDRVVIRVGDRGPGIAEADRSHVFEPYFTTRRRGTGLGLAIAKNVVDALGGRIEARARDGGGAEIVFELPRERAPRAR